MSLLLLLFLLFCALLFNAIAEIRYNFLDPMGAGRRRFSTTGTRGTFEIRPLEPQTCGRLGIDRSHGEFAKRWQDVPLEKPTGRYDGEFIDLARVIGGEKKLAWDAAHDIAPHEALLKGSGMLR